MNFDVILNLFLLSFFFSLYSNSFKKPFGTHTARRYHRLLAKQCYLSIITVLILFFTVLTLKKDRQSHLGNTVPFIIIVPCLFAGGTQKGVVLMEVYPQPLNVAQSREV